MTKRVKEKSPIVVPRRYKENPRGYDRDVYNWDYKCECGEIIGPWTLTCPKCGSDINWNESN